MIVITISVLFLFLIWLFSNGEKENTTISPGKPENACLRKLEGKAGVPIKEEIQRRNLLKIVDTVVSLVSCPKFGTQLFCTGFPTKG